jgi:hypothetical protein
MFSIFRAWWELKWFLFLYVLWELFDKFSLEVVPCSASWNFTLPMCRTQWLLHRYLKIFICIASSCLAHCPVCPSHQDLPEFSCMSHTTECSLGLSSLHQDLEINFQHKAKTIVKLSLLFPFFLETQCCVACFPIYEDSCSMLTVQFPSCLTEKKQFQNLLFPCG